MGDSWEIAGVFQVYLQTTFALKAALMFVRIVWGEKDWVKVPLILAIHVVGEDPGSCESPYAVARAGGRGVFNSSSRIESHGSSRCCCCSTSRCSHAVSARSTSGEMTDDACFCDEPRRSCAAFLAFLADSWESCGSFRRTASFCGMCWLGVCAIVYITFRDTIGERPRHAAHCCFRPAAPHCRASPRS